MRHSFVITLVSAVALPALSIPSVAQTTSTQAKTTKTAPAKTTPAKTAAAPAKPAVVKITSAPAKPVAVKTTSTPTRPAAVQTASAPTRPVAAQTASAPTANMKTAAAPVSTANKIPNVAATGGASPNSATVATANTTTAANSAVVAGSGQAATAQPAYALQQQATDNSQGVNTGAAAGGAGTMSGAANGATASTGYAAGLGTFNAGGLTATAFNCLRSGNRVFCDFDETSNSNGEIPAGYGFNQTRLVLGSGRVYTPHVAHYVDADGSTFDTAELTANTAVRLVLEYDDIPAQYTTVALAFGRDKISAVPITDMAATQSPNLIAPRQSPAQSAGGQAAAAPNAAGTSTMDKAGQGIDKIKSTKSGLSDLWKRAKTVTQN